MPSIVLRAMCFACGFGGANFAAYHLLMVPLERKHADHLAMLTTAESQLQGHCDAISDRISKLQSVSVS